MNAAAIKNTPRAERDTERVVTILELLLIVTPLDLYNMSLQLVCILTLGTLSPDSSKVIII